MSERVPELSHAFDVAVIGAGPAGIAAATRAAEAGRSTVLLDASPRPGGQIWRHRTRAELPAPARRRLERLDRSGAVPLLGAAVVDARADRAGGFVLSLERDAEGISLRAGRIILATGARELFLPFPGWTLPNVIGVGGAQALLRSGASFSGKRVVIAGSGPLLLAVAATLRAHGATVAVIAEQASKRALLRFHAGLWRTPGRLARALAYRAALPGTRFVPDAWVVRADGDDAVREVTLTDGRRSWIERCDVLCTGFGLVPNTELAELLGCDVDDGRVRVDPWQRTTVDGVFCAGEPTGIAGATASLVEGEIAGAAAVLDTSGLDRLFAFRRREHEFARRLESTFALRPELREVPEQDTILCRCEDVAFSALEPGWSFRQAMLYTRIGMGPCQGRICGPAYRHLFGRAPRAVRVPASPASVGTLASTLTPQQDPDDGGAAHASRPGPRDGDTAP